MKNLFFIALALLSINLYSQSKKKTKIQTTSLIFTVDSSEEVKKINWDDTKEFFEDADEDEEITLGIKVKKNGKVLKSDSKHNFLISGKVKNLDNLIKIISNYEVETTPKVKMSSLIYTVDSVEELQEIDWEEVKKSFVDKDEDEEITLGCKVKKSEDENSKLNIKQSFIISGKVKDLDKLIKIMSNYTKNQK
ncbi:hypothetical protein ACOSP6_09380 [Tenacibaculum sp. MEBiC06402]|uniref:hypothetical protein n=1 Tax=unclassified Tenacibaculum TaxID=2635139 RepID=UPI003B9A3DA6